VKYSEIRNALGKVEEFNKTCVDVALAGVDQLILLDQQPWWRYAL